MSGRGSDDDISSRMKSETVADAAEAAPGPRRPVRLGVVATSDFGAVGVKCPKVHRFSKFFRQIVAEIKLNLYTPFRSRWGK